MTRVPRFIASRSSVKAACERLSLVRKGNWSLHYIDPVTSEEWTRYPMWDYHGSGPECLRRGDPTLSETFDAIEQAEFDEEVAAASYYAVNELRDGKENLQLLVDCLERLMHQDEKAFSRKVALAVAWSQADKAFNHRVPTGKSYAEIVADYEHFKAIAERAAILRRSAEKVCGKVSPDAKLFE